MSSLPGTTEETGLVAGLPEPSDHAEREDPNDQKRKGATDREKRADRAEGCSD
ncbi:MAG TPA: hypothetical protein VIP57_12030 [Candidatus Dormibacteraeota bacterium]